MDDNENAVAWPAGGILRISKVGNSRVVIKTHGYDEYQHAHEEAKALVGELVSLWSNPGDVQPSDEQDVLMQWENGVTLRGKWFNSLGFAVIAHKGSHYVGKVGVVRWMPLDKWFVVEQAITKATKWLEGK